MATLDELMGMNGVVAAGQFSDDGKLVDVRGQLKPEVSQTAAQFCGSSLFQVGELARTSPAMR